MLTAKKATVPPEIQQSIAIGFLLGLLILGYMTLRRILKRNATTDGFKKDLRRIRDIYRDYYDPDLVLVGYHGFAPGHSASKKKKSRKYGGLADLVSALNSLVIAALAGTISSHFGASLAIAGVIGVASFMISAVAHRRYVQKKHQKIDKKLRDLPLTHAGGVVVTSRDGVLKYLVAQPSDGADKWILPKGKIEAGEDPRDAALREVAEETGVRARLMRPLPIIEFEVNGKPVRAKFYLMELIFEGTSIEKKVERQTDWLSFDEAMAARLPKEAKKLVVVAERHALALNLQGN